MSNKKKSRSLFYAILCNQKLRISYLSILIMSNDYIYKTYFKNLSNHFIEIEKNTFGVKKLDGQSSEYDILKIKVFKYLDCSNRCRTK